MLTNACRLGGGEHVFEVIDLLAAHPKENKFLRSRDTDTAEFSWLSASRDTEKRGEARKETDSATRKRKAWAECLGKVDWPRCQPIFLLVHHLLVPTTTTRPVFPSLCDIMLVDNVLHQPSPPLKPSDLADFVNLDLFASQASATSDSRDPSPSVATPLFSPLPLISEPNPSDWFNFSLDDDFVKPDPHVPPPVTAVPWDFLSFPNDHTDTGGTNTNGDLSPAFAIDPQLMSSPAPPKPLPAVDETKDRAEKKLEEEDLEEEVVTSPTIKVGGKGKSRKGTVHSGGVQKKATISAVVRDQDDPREDGDDWRPSPEEYKKMSSKEKRQLRNKISARNFRVRRKGNIIVFCTHVVTYAIMPEYITTLEGDIAERDRLIDAIRSELGSSQSENAALRQEISALKKALLASADRAESPVLPPPGPIPAPAPVVRAGPSSSLVTPNTQKDLPSSPHLVASPSKAFWGGSASFGGITPVHTTLIPENLIHPLAGVKSLSEAPAHSPASKENINPSLNSDNSSLSSNPTKIGRFDTFTEANPFIMKTLDA